MMTPLQYETMMIVPRVKPARLRLHYGHDLVLLVSVCWAAKWFAEDSPFHPTDYSFRTLGLDGIP